MICKQCNKELSIGYISKNQYKFCSYLCIQKYDIKMEEQE